MKEEDEFKERLAEEREFRERFLREQAAKLKRVTQVVDKLVGTATMPKPAVVIAAPKAALKQTKPHEWALEVTESNAGMMRTVEAYCDGNHRYTFHIERNRNGYVKQILAVPA